MYQTPLDPPGEAVLDLEHARIATPAKAAGATI